MYFLNTYSHCCWVECYRCPLAVVGISVRKSSISLLIFNFAGLPTENGILRSPNTIVELFIFSFNYVSFCFVYFETVLLGTYLFIIVISSSSMASLSFKISFLSSVFVFPYIFFHLILIYLPQFFLITV